MFTFKEFALPRLVSTLGDKCLKHNINFNYVEGSAKVQEEVVAICCLHWKLQINYLHGAPGMSLTCTSHR